MNDINLIHRLSQLGLYTLSESKKTPPKNKQTKPHTFKPGTLEAEMWGSELKVNLAFTVSTTTVSCQGQGYVETLSQNKEKQRDNTDK